MNFPANLGILRFTNAVEAIGVFALFLTLFEARSCSLEVSPFSGLDFLGSGDVIRAEQILLST